ncbi:MAG TPA: T9SS type A sorting domain-containing protein, partial [Bacteroidota bacterium]|nr:T9SS type A sorting domain-containing protein [Bacteroidota bacterium]
CSSQALYDQYITDWNEWPADLGAPFVYGKDAAGIQRNAPAPYDPNFDTPGEPDADQTLWHVSNDLDLSRIAHFSGASEGLGLEVQRTIWGYHQPQTSGWSSYGKALDQTIFIRTLLINKSGYPIDSMYIGQWSDPDIGGTTGGMMNYLGCDTTRNLGYAYGAGADSSFGSAVPAGGFVFLQGPLVPSPGSTAVFRWHELHGYKNLPMTAFADASFLPLPPPPPGIIFVPFDAIGFYHMLQGLVGRTGAVMIDPTTGDPTPSIFPGDPVMHSGWTALNRMPPSDIRIVMGSGPFRMAAGDTQEVIVANIAGVSYDPFMSLTALRQTAGTALMAYLGAVSAESVEGVRLPKSGTPASFELMQNYPNPFNPSTTIPYSLPRRARVTLTVYNVLGELVSILVDEEQSAGVHQATFGGSNFASGVYLSVLRSGGLLQTRRMLLVR